MMELLTLDVNRRMDEVLTFGRWFRPILESSGLKHAALAKEAAINPVSLSRILSGEHGIKVETARDLARAINRMTGRDLADEETAVKLAVGIAPEAPSESLDIPGVGTLSFDKRIAQKDVARMKAAYRVALEMARDSLAREEIHNT